MDFNQARSLLATDDDYNYAGPFRRPKNKQLVVGRDPETGEPIYGEGEALYELTVPRFIREPITSLLNVAEGSQTGVVNPEDVLNIAPLGAGASLLDDGIQGGFSAGMFIGRNNPLFNEESLKLASDLKSKGESNRLIFDETGAQTGTPTFYGRDGQPRQEVSDANKINYRKLSAGLVEIGAESPNLSYNFDLADLIDDPNYLKMIAGAYGELPSVKLMSHTEAMSNLYRRGSFDPDTKQIKLNPYRADPTVNTGYSYNDPESLRSTLLHEIQHKIQQDDNLSGGSNQSQSMQESKDFTNKAAYLLKDQKDLVEADRYKLKQFRKAERVDQLYEDSQRLRNSSDPLTVETARLTIEGHKEYPELRAAYQQKAGKPPKDGTPESREWWAGLSAYMADEIRDTIDYGMALNADKSTLRTMANIAYERAYGKPSEKLNYLRDIVSIIKQFRRDGLNPNSSEDPAYTFYRRNLGETEARATQRRENLSDRDRARMFPEDTYDIDPQSVIFETQYLTPESLLGMGVKRNRF